MLLGQKSRALRQVVMPCPIPMDHTLMFALRFGHPLLLPFSLDRPSNNFRVSNLLRLACLSCFSLVVDPISRNDHHEEGPHAMDVEANLDVARCTWLTPRHQRRSG